jgi:hypothetical protein
MKHWGDCARQFLRTQEGLCMTDRKREVTKALEEAGFELVRERKHRIFRDARDKTVVTSSTPSDGNAFRQQLKDIRRAEHDADRKIAEPSIAALPKTEKKRGGITGLPYPRAKGTPALRLEYVPEYARPRARQHLKNGDMQRFFFMAEHSSMRLLLDNLPYFRSEGLFERAFIAAWSSQRYTGWIEWKKDGGFVTGSWSPLAASMLEKICDREKLIEAGDPLPAGDRFTIFRGVSNSEYANGISWTLALDVALRFPFFEDPCIVYSTEVKRADIFAYIDEKGRGEKEVLVKLPGNQPMIERYFFPTRDARYRLIASIRGRTAREKESPFPVSEEARQGAER